MDIVHGIRIHYNIDNRFIKMNSYYFIKIIRACLNLVQSATSVKFNFVLCLPVGRQIKNTR